MATLSDLTPYFLKSNWLLSRVARTSDTILGVTDKGKWFDITSGTFSQTFTAAATLGAGWWCWLGNSGTGEITLDPNGSEQIDGLANYIAYPGEVRLVVCTGTAFETILLQGFRYAYTASGTFTKPPGYHSFDVEIWAAGGSGARANTGANASGGGGGGYWRDQIAASVIGATEAVTVGSGGPAKSSPGDDGGAGGDSTFAGLTPQGGARGVAGASGVGISGGQGGAALPSTYVSSVMPGFYGSWTDKSNIYGGAGAGDVNTSDIASNGGKTVYGGAPGGSLGNASGIASPGVSLRGGAGGVANASGAATAGTAPGGGGGASRGGNSGAGARGEVRIVGVF